MKVAPNKTNKILTKRKNKKIQDDSPAASESENEELSPSDVEDRSGDSIENGHESESSEAEEKDGSEISKEDDNGNESSDIEEKADFGVSHKKSLANLEKTDPEFYAFLKENDKKLLDFESSSEEEEAEEEDDDEDFVKDGVHRPPAKLHVDSEESDMEEEEVGKKRSSNVVTFAMVDKWRESLISEPCVQSISRAVEAFHAALDRVSGEDNSDLKVEGGGVFNAIIEMCVIHLQTAVVEFLKLSPGTIKHPEKSKKWVKVKSLLEAYFTDLFKLLNGVASEHIVSVLLKHLHSCCALVVHFPRLCKIALKHLTRIWSTGEETVRVLAYLCILRMCTINKINFKLLNSSLKLMYIAYVRGSKFVSVNTLPQINFMKRSLVDLFSLDPVLSYQHVFLYIRQLAIHLRNAITLHKKECFQTVYNWQYIHSLKLWVDLMCTTKDNPDLHQLLYPLVQVIIGCIKLIPTAQYIPLRFQCIQMLIKVNRETSTYVPVLPFIIESLSCVDINKPNKVVSMKPFDLSFVLRLSKAAMTENAFTDAVVENVYLLTLQAAATYAHKITFPDLFVPAIVQLKIIIKKCKSSKYNNKLKQIVFKLEENSKFISNERNKLNANLNEQEKIRAFESEILLKNPPLVKYWEQLQKVNKMQQNAVEKEEKVQKKQTESLPVVKKKTNLKRKQEDADGPVELFPSDESDFEFPNLDSPPPEEEKLKRKKKKVKSVLKQPTSQRYTEVDDVHQEDIVQDLNIQDF